MKKQTVYFEIDGATRSITLAAQNSRQAIMMVGMLCPGCKVLDVQPPGSREVTISFTHKKEKPLVSHLFLN